MRRIAAVVSAGLLTAVLAGTVLAAGPTSKVNRFTGDFDMLDQDTGQVVGHIVARFTEPSLTKLVPGTIDVTWSPNVTDATFAFMNLDWKPVKESHAQLLRSFFGVEPGYATVAGGDGYLCDYTAPWNADCRPFAIHFDIPFDGSSRVVWWDFQQIDEHYKFVVGPGAFAFTYAGPTGS